MVSLITFFHTVVCQQPYMILSSRICRKRKVIIKLKKKKNIWTSTDRQFDAPESLFQNMFATSSGLMDRLDAWKSLFLQLFKLPQVFAQKQLYPSLTCNILKQGFVNRINGSRTSTTFLSVTKPHLLHSYRARFSSMIQHIVFRPLIKIC